MNKLELLKLCIQSIKQQHQKEQRWLSTLREMFDSCTPVSVMSDNIHNALLKCLEFIFNDEKDQMISYFLYEKPEPYEPCVWEGDKEIPLETVEDLYNYLVNKNECT